eukprot:CAMPEP_0167814562 /NCGR_PEP_ID=MMETSP0112_2-20121227/2493_1 /TAXON_ID=91324 /ORGANISM="Lotharella globosa, Strain CCCM811" /LENGTH=325 /DNA_ID=CAMNT_0007713799 /DNA_START=8 /DNA_END=986 /DNA_ORIENTATION=-
MPVSDRSDLRRFSAANYPGFEKDRPRRPTPPAVLPHGAAREFHRECFPDGERASAEVVPEESEGHRKGLRRVAPRHPGPSRVPLEHAFAAGVVLAKTLEPVHDLLGVEVMAIILPGAAHFEEIYNISQTMFIVVIIVPLAFTFFQTLFSIDARLAEVIPPALLDFNHENVCGRVFLLTVMLLIFLFISALSLNHVELRVHLHEKLQTDEHLLEDHADAMHAIFGAIFAMVFWSLSPDRRVGDNQGMSRAETEIDSNLMEFTPSSRGSNATPSSQLSSLASAEEPASPAVADHGNSETSRRSDATSRPQNSSRESLEAKATEGLPE